MKNLLVLRHAKSDWNNPNMSDFERPLNGRGLRSALQMGAFLQEKKLEPDLIVSSPAVRAKDTAELIKDAAQFLTELKFEPRIYEATVNDLIDVLKQIPKSCQVLLIVGHNPGFENLIESLTGETREMPTAALAEVHLNIEDWSEIDVGQGNLKNLYKPKELEETN
jgi:phosphohistidine phosphatase